MLVISDILVTSYITYIRTSYMYDIGNIIAIINDVLAIS